MSALALTAGALMAVVGGVDVALLWWPLRFSNVEWEFATVSATFNSLPLFTIGVVLLATAAIDRQQRRVTRFLSVVVGVMVLFCTALALLYLLAIPIAWRGTPEAAREILVKSLLKTSIYAAVYTVFFAWLFRRTWKESRVREGVGRPEASVLVSR